MPKKFENEAEKKFYKCWTDIKTRCNKSNCKKYPLYGGRGIKMCESWLSFKNFYNDMWDSYIKHYEEHIREVDGKIKHDTTLDRIDCNKNYDISNCRWATYKEQRLNVRNKASYSATNLLTGEVSIIKNLTDFCKENNLARARVTTLMKEGEPIAYKNWVLQRLTKKENECPLETSKNFHLQSNT